MIGLGWLALQSLTRNHLSVDLLLQQESGEELVSLHLDSLLSDRCLHFSGSRRVPYTSSFTSPEVLCFPELLTSLHTFITKAKSVITSAFTLPYLMTPPCSPPGMALQGFPFHCGNCGVDVSMTGAWSSGLYKTRTGMDEAKQLFVQQVSKVFPFKFAVRLEQRKERTEGRDQDPQHLCVVVRARSKELFQDY